jgi:zinc protease
MKNRIARPSKFILAALAALALAVPAAMAQQQESKDTPVSQVERKGKAPVSGEVLRVKLPAAKEFTLPNGLTVLVMEDHRFPAVTAQFLIAGSGGLNEPRELPGLAWMTAQMLTEGTKKRSSRELTEEVARLGATLNAGADFGSEGASISASGLSDNFEEWFALVVEVLLEPSFPAQELQRLVGRTKVNLRQQRSQPNFLVNERFSQAVYGSHPAAVVSTTPEALDQLTPERLAAWHRERYVPQNAILGVAGDVNAAALKAKLEKWLAAWKRTDQPDVLPPDPKPVAKKQIHLVDRPKSEQTTLWLGNIAIKRTDPDYPAMVVMNRVVGGGASARLFLNLREEKGYTYGAYSTLQAERYAGPWRAFANVRTEVTEGAMTEFLNEINRIRNEKVPAAELEEAKRAMVANFALSLEQPAQLLSYAITRKIYNLPDDYWEKYPAQLLAVSAEDVQRVARKYINPDALQIAAVGDASRIREVMEKFGPVVMYDAEGKPVAEAAASATAPGR